MPRKTDQVHVVGKVRLVCRGKWWHAQYTTPSGRVRKALKLSNLKAAQVKAREIDDILQAGQFASLERIEKHQHDLFKDFVEEIFLPQYPGWSEGTHKSTKSLVAKLVEEFGDRPLAGITGDDIESYLARRRGDDEWADSSYNRYLAIIKSIFKYAEERGRIIHNPADSAKTLRLQKKNPNPYSDEEVKRLLAELEPRQEKRGIALVALDTGMRRGELMNLMWNDVDFEKGRIVLKETKNKEDRIIPMTARVSEHLSQLYEANKLGQRRSLYVWGISADIRQLLGRAGKRVGIERATMHRLRDTFGTRLADKGVPLDRIKKLMGHKTVEMTLRYVETRDHHLEDAIASISE